MIFHQKLSRFKNTVAHIGYIESRKIRLLKRYPSRTEGICGGIAVTIYDKWAAKNRPKKRTRESTLLLLSALGGSIAMLLTMYGIRHKTKHIKFMLGIPLIILLQVGAVAALLFLI